MTSDDAARPAFVPAIFPQIFSNNSVERANFPQSLVLRCKSKHSSRSCLASRFRSPNISFLSSISGRQHCKPASRTFMHAEAFSVRSQIPINEDGNFLEFDSTGPAVAVSENPMERRINESMNEDGEFDFDEDKPREECGIVGVYGDPEASNLAYLALHSLQHRGQEGAGIVSSDGRTLRSHLGLGLVSELFSKEDISKLTGHISIGHVRYSTAGEKTIRNVQPFVVRYRDGQVAIGHNGNLTNARVVRRELEMRGSIFNTSSDTETILHLLATSIQGTFIKRLTDALLRVEGAYSLVLLTENQLIAVRDPFGFRPLVIGQRDGVTVFASETCALDLLGATFVREVDPGEMVVVDENGLRSMFPFPRVNRKACVFEHIYFARPNSVVFGRSVYGTRFRFGQLLSKVLPVDADAVIPIPDSGIAAALGFAADSGIPFQYGLIRSHYVGRTFIEPTQSIRAFGVKLKLSTVRAILEGKSVVVVDDSLVRGTTSKKIVNLLREAGAREVHMRICSPPMIGSCFYGVDTPNEQELIAHTMNVERIREFIDADSLAYLPLDAMRDELADEASTFCDACFSRDYPVKVADNSLKTLKSDGVPIAV